MTSVKLINYSSSTADWNYIQKTTTNKSQRANQIKKERI